MSFEVEHALRDMDQKTTPYLLEEIFHHGDLKVRIDAARELAMLDPTRRTTRLLLQILQIIPD